jgi:Ser/Thr protein kinase RdoA (MazF antagonist)
VLQLSRIDALRASIDDEWRSPVADQAAAAWALPAGAARFWRSSASHVFVVDLGGERGFLRLSPADLVDQHHVESVATLMHRLATGGLGCVDVVPSVDGRAMVTVDSSVGPLHATLVRAATGDTWDADDVAAAQAEQWGAALARVHEATPTADGIALPDGAEQCERALEAVSTDARLAEAAAALSAQLAGLPRDDRVYGLVHGDFELDNIAWHDGLATAYDWDEAERSWFAADIAYAVRDLLPDPGVLLDVTPPLVGSFLSGYRSVRPDAAIDAQQLVLFTAVNAARSLARLAPVLAEDPSAGARLAAAASDDPMPSLRQRLEHYADRQRTLVLELGGLLATGA